jgi:hypothetical protein
MSASHLRRLDHRHAPKFRGDPVKKSVMYNSDGFGGGFLSVGGFSCISHSLGKL